MASPVMVQIPVRLRVRRGSSIPTQLAVLTGRSLQAMTADLRVLVLGMLSPLLMLIVFGQIFAGVADSSLLPPDTGYIDYLMPAILLNAGLGAAQTAGMALIDDMDNGVLARFRSLPISMSCVLFARSVADLIRAGAQLVVVLIVGSGVFGFAPAGGLLGTFGALLVALLISWSMIWVFLALASWLRSAEAMQSIGVIVMFPLLFASSAFVPVDTMPGWLRAIAVVNPLTYGVDACRQLVLATPAAGGALVATVTICLALGGVSMLAAARWFNRPAAA